MSKRATFFTRSLLADPATLGSVNAHFTGWDNTNLTINTNGTGGAPANGQRFGRITDISGNGNHLVQAAALNRPIWAGQGIAFPLSITDTSFVRSGTTTPSLHSNNASGGVVCDFQGVGASATAGVQLFDCTDPVSHCSCQMAAGTQGVIYLNNINFVIASIFPTGRRCVVTWRATASDFIIRVNGGSDRLQQTNLGSSLIPASNVINEINVCTYDGGLATGGMRLREWISYNSDIGATNMLALERYFRFRIGNFDSTRNVFVLGDSLSQGVGSVNSTAWTDYVTNRQDSAWYLNCQAGNSIGAGTPIISSAQVSALKGSNEGIFILWMGVNDLLNFARTGVQTEAAISAFCTTVRAAGYKVIVTTMHAFTASGAVQTERTSLNNLLIANHASYSDAIVRLDSQAFLSNPANVTYYQSDGVHLTDAAYTLIGSLFQIAMEGIPPT